MQNEIPLQLVREYMARHVPNPNDEPCTYEENTITTWAAGEILDDILNHPMTPAVDTVERFSIKMELFFYESTKPCNKLIFSIARDTAEDIGSMLI